MVNPRKGHPCASYLSGRLPQVVLAKRRPLTSAGIRVGGAILLLLSVSLGIRWLGDFQFGLAMLATAIGQGVAFPITSLGRLIIRSATNGDSTNTAKLLIASRCFSALVLALTVIACVWSIQRRPDAIYFVMASGATAVMMTEATTRQSLNRAQERLVWSQVPLELFRPAATILGFGVAACGNFHEPGAVATLIASATTLFLVVLAPKYLPQQPVEGTVAAGKGLSRSSIALIGLTLIALLVERGLTIGLGALDSPTAVTKFTVIFRVIQIAIFAQAFAVFYYSPALARLHSSGHSGTSAASLLTRRIQALGFASAAPLALLCLLVPGLITQVMGTSMNMALEFRWAALAMLALTLGGAAQARLIMSGYETPVALAAGAALVLSCAPILYAGALTSVTAVAALATYYTVLAAVQVLLARRHFAPTAMNSMV